MIDAKTFDFFASHLYEVDDLLLAYDAFRPEVGKRFVSALRRRVEADLASDGWKPIARQTIDGETDHCGIEPESRPKVLQIVVGTYAKEPFPFCAPWIGVRIGPSMPARLRKRLVDPVRQAMNDLECHPTPSEALEEAWLAWARMDYWPDASRPSAIQPLLVSDENALIDDILLHLGKLKIAVAEGL